MMVLIYGFSLMFILSGVMSYELGIIEVLGIAVACYLFDKVIFKTLRRFLTILLSVIITLGIVTYVLYRFEELEYVLMEIADFVKVYYLSITVDTVSINVFHQMILISLIGVILMRLLEKYIHIKKRNYIYLEAVTAVLILGGYLASTLGSAKDHQAFMIMCATMILYYFYNYYRSLTGDEKSFAPLMSTVVLFVVIIVIGARMLYSWDSRPLTSPVVKPKFQVSSDVATEVFETDKMSYYRQDTFAIQESFEFQNVDVMRVKTQNLRYLKAETYEVYENGAWLRFEDLSYLQNDGDAIHKSQAFEQINYTDYYIIENIEVTIRNINTNVLFMGNYGASDTYFESGVRIMYDPRRGIYFADQLLEHNYKYNFNAVVPSYGNPNFDNLVRVNSEKTLPAGLGVYQAVPEEGYEDLAALAREITDGIDNKYDQVLAIETYLRENYVYSEDPGPVPEGVDPINHFLFETKEGFCQQFSSAFILMARSLDIPARYATGFYVDIFEPESEEEFYMMEMEYMRDGLTTVFDSDSHTWAEAYFPEVGWIMFEATPGRIYRKEVADALDLELADDILTEDKRSGFVVNMNYIYAFFGVILLGVILYGSYRFMRWRKTIKHQNPMEKMLSIHRIIRYYYGSGVVKKGLQETPREYARRIDDYMMDAEDEGMTRLMEDYEDVIYGGSDIEYDDLDKHLDYLRRTKSVMRRRVNQFTFIRMQIFGNLNYVPLNKAQKA